MFICWCWLVILVLEMSCCVEVGKIRTNTYYCTRTVLSCTVFVWRISTAYSTSSWAAMYFRHGSNFGPGCFVSRRKLRDLLTFSLIFAWFPPLHFSYFNILKLHYYFMSKQNKHNLLGSPPCNITCHTPGNGYWATSNHLYMRHFPVRLSRLSDTSKSTSKSSLELSIKFTRPL